MYALPVILFSACLVLVKALTLQVSIFSLLGTCEGSYTAGLIVGITWTPDDLHELSDTQSILMYHSV